jgi:hypothetical protein
MSEDKRASRSCMDSGPEDYYERRSTEHTDGTRSFQTPADRAKERRVAEFLEKHWNCEIHSFGALAPIDWWASRHERVTAVIEIKSRSHPCGEYPTVFLNVRKWLALTLASVGLGVSALFVVKWQDCLGFVRVDEIDASKVRIGGCKRIVKSENDIEPVIEVPVDQFTTLE